jgi:hypothetical protein
MGQGKVTRFSPDGWTDLHYDLEPSPIGGIFGRSDGGLLGPNGLIADGTTLFEDLQDMEDNPQIDQRQALATLLQSVRVIGNAANLDRRAQLEKLTSNEIKDIAVEKGIRFIGKARTIDALMNLE